MRGVKGKGYRVMEAGGRGQMEILRYSRKEWRGGVDGET